MGESSLIVLAGNPPSDELLLLHLEYADRSIAVDGGFLTFIHANHLPDILIGDLDSVPNIEDVYEKYPNLKVVKVEDQDITDFQKALAWIDENSDTTQLIILGGLGRRTDHLITNLLVAMNVDESVEITFDSDSEWIRRVTAICPLHIHGRKGDTISILPIQSSSGVNSKGLKWDLINHSLGNQKIIGQSNLCESDDVEIRCDAGSFYVFLEKGNK